MQRTPRLRLGSMPQISGAGSLIRDVGPWLLGEMPFRLTMLLVLLCGLLSCRQESISSTLDRSASYAVVITTIDREWKIRAIKTVREETGLGLADAKNLVEKLPATVKDGLTAAEAEALIRKLEASGMKAEARR
jgi:hypothetical protein